LKKDVKKSRKSFNQVNQGADKGANFTAKGADYLATNGVKPYSK